MLLPLLPNGEPPPWPRPRPCAGGGALGSRVISQTPDRSGWPSAARGVAAFASSLASGPIGTPVAVYFGHCAITVVDATNTKARTTCLFISSPPPLHHRPTPSTTIRGTACGHRPA